MSSTAPRVGGDMRATEQAANVYKKQSLASKIMDTLQVLK